MTKPLMKRIDEIRERIRSKNIHIPDESDKHVVSDAKSEKKSLLHILPDCSKDICAIPNVILRGALFGVVGKGHRKYEKNVLKATINGITVKFTGEQLDQTDLDVWSECLRLCKKIELGERIHFSSHAFLKGIGRTTGNSQHEWLKSSLLRLSACVLELGDGRFFYVGHLLHEWYRDEESGANVIALNPKVSALFSSDLWTGLSTKERAALKGKPLAQWLHGFYSTHEKPLGYKVETLLRLCGSEVFALKTFKQKLKKSLTDLSLATGWKFSIDENNLVHVKKK